MAIKQTKIDGYTIDLDTAMDGEGVTGCWIGSRSGSASLQCLIDTGVIEDDDGRAFPVSDKTIRKIEEWANANGY